MTTTPPIDDRTIARWRLANQRLTGPPQASVSDTVTGLLCVQAENYVQASWAIAARTAGVTQAAFAASFDRGEILRTHVLRPTWHFVTPDDIGWLLDLTRPRIWPSRKRLATQFGLDEQRLNKAAHIITSAIDARGPLKRGEIVQGLSAASLPAEGHGLSMSLEFAEVEGLICSGPMIDGEHTHALLHRRAPDTRRLDRDAAIAELTLRYLTSHGPATEADLSYWASLTLTDARAGVRSIADQLDSFDHDGRTFWHIAGTAPPTEPNEPHAHLLQILDECYRGYQDSRWVLDTDQVVPRTREKTTGIALIDAQIVATLRRSIKADQVRFHLGAYRSLTGTELAHVSAAAGRYAHYLELEPEVVWER